MNPQKGESSMNNDNKPADKTQDRLTTKQAAKFLGVSKRTIQRYRKEGILTPQLVKGSCRYSKVDLIKGVTSLLERGDKLLKFRPEVMTSYQKLVTSFEQGVTRSTALVPISADNSRPDANEQGVTSSEQGVTSSEQGMKSSEQGMKRSDPNLIYVVEGAETLIQNAAFVSPTTLYSPKDKVSNMTWINKIPCNIDKGIITIRKSEEFGCIVRLNYDKIFADEHVITGANFSDFDRALYDAVVTLMVAGNNIFSNTALWRVITQNPDAKLNDSNRLKIVKSMFHIGNFLISIVTDYSKKADVWADFNSDSTQRPFKSERKFYKKLQAIYGGRLLEFRWIAERSITITRTVDGQEITERKDIPEIWQFIAPPILYQYAADKEQVASIAMTLLNTSDKTDNKPALRRGSHTDELANFLAREIDTMKKKPNYSKIIVLDRIYSIDGIDEVQQDKNDLKKKKKRTRDKLEKILFRLKENGLIQGHKFHKKVIGKATTFYSVEILI